MYHSQDQSCFDPNVHKKWRNHQKRYDRGVSRVCFGFLQHVVRSKLSESRHVFLQPSYIVLLQKGVILRLHIHHDYKAQKYLQCHEARSKQSNRYLLHPAQRVFLIEGNVPTGLFGSLKGLHQGP
jgi:hypothetical protein